MNPSSHVLLVNADEQIRQTHSDVLRQEPTLHVTTAGSTAEAQNQIKQQKFDEVIFTQLLPHPSDALNIFTAAQAANPDVRKVMLNTYPQLNPHEQGIIGQTQLITVKPGALNRLIPDVKETLATPFQIPQPIQSVASILERATQVAIEQWYTYVGQDETLMAVKLTKEQRCNWLPQMFNDLNARLVATRPLGSAMPVSQAAIQHGTTRFQQKYTAPMLADESRLLSAAVYQTLENNRANIDYQVLFPAIQLINDEINGQLTQALNSFVRQGVQEQVPA